MIQIFGFFTWRFNFGLFRRIFGLLWYKGRPVFLLTISILGCCTWYWCILNICTIYSCLRPLLAKVIIWSGIHLGVNLTSENAYSTYTTVEISCWQCKTKYCYSESPKRSTKHCPVRNNYRKIVQIRLWNKIDLSIFRCLDERYTILTHANTNTLQ